MATKKDSGSNVIPIKEPEDNNIQLYFHCSLCLDEKPEDQSPQEWGRLEVGWTKQGIQIWCKRHDVNVMHMNFEGTQHPATTARLI